MSLGITPKEPARQNVGMRLLKNTFQHSMCVEFPRSGFFESEQVITKLWVHWVSRSKPEAK